MAKIAFIGLGNMGGHMAANLVKAQHKVRAFDLVKDLCATAEKEGCEIASSAKDAVKDAEFVVTMLPAGPQVRAVWADIIDSVPKSALMIDCSTIDMASAKEVLSLAKSRGIEAVDAPVSGGTMGAKAATLTLMVGGTEAAYAKAKPILEKVGRRAVYCGDAGMGQAAKICNNMMAGIEMLAISEAFVLAERLGLSHQAMFDVVSTSSGQCFALTSMAPVPAVVPQSAANNDFKPGFALPLMIKDLKLAQAAAQGSGANCPLGGLAVQIYEIHENLGNSHKDFSSVIETIRGKK